MIPPEFKVFLQVIDQIRAEVDIENPPNNKYHVITIPHSPYVFKEELEQYGLLDNVVKLHSFQWMPIHLDSGVLSLEMPMLYSTLFVYENYALLPVLAKCLWQLSFVVGKLIYSSVQYLHCLFRETKFDNSLGTALQQFNETI